MTLNEFAEKAHNIAKEKGFWQERLSNEHCLMLVITEIAEMIEADRKDVRANLMAFEAGLKYTPKNVTPNERFASVFKVIKGSIEDEMADIAIRLADLAGALEIDLENMKIFSYHREFGKFRFTENAFQLISYIMKLNLPIDKTIAFALNYVFKWAESLNIELWFFIEQKIKYNALRPVLHEKRY